MTNLKAKIKWWKDSSHVTKYADIPRLIGKNETNITKHVGKNSSDNSLLVSIVYFYHIFIIKTVINVYSDNKLTQLITNKSVDFDARRTWKNNRSFIILNDWYYLLNIYIQIVCLQIYKSHQVKITSNAELFKNKLLSRRDYPWIKNSHYSS